MRVLIVEDEQALREGLTDLLTAAGHEVVACEHGKDAVAVGTEEVFELVLLDLMLPDIDGVEVCRRLRRARPTLHILMLTARGSEDDRVKGLALGADDYMSKPFSVRELLARIRALIRRTAPAPALPEELRLGTVVIDFRRFEAAKDGETFRLTRKEFGTLRYLAARPGEVVRREELLREVWEYKAYPTTRTVDNHIASLRAKIEDDASNPRFLQTVHGVGYKLVL